MRFFSVLLLSFVSARGYGKVKNEERKVLRATFFILHFSLFTFRFSLFVFHFSLHHHLGYPFSYAHHIHAGGQRKNMVAGGGVHRANE